MSLGFQPRTEPLTLTSGADFVQMIEPSGHAVFPNNTTIWIDLLGPRGEQLAKWDADVQPRSATWIVQSGLADLIPAGAHYRCMVSYATTPSTEYALFVGRVVRVGPVAVPAP
ncbi:hypothetical protein GS982_20385 [Rhodococcus hoagii]|nr:hypothetical protein [Prescottella equi]NKZ84553.1 hypothetical protein [Prescottella equi]